MRTDSEIKRDVLEELIWQPGIDETEIGVTVEDGIVTLNGVINSYAKKKAAERAVKSVKGVRGVAMDIQILYGSGYRKTDTEIAKAVADALEWNSSVPHHIIEIRVEEGWVFLSGRLKWFYQKEAARDATENLLGVKGVNLDALIIEGSDTGDNLENDILKALERSAYILSKGIRVQVEGSTVQLKGRVGSFKEKEEAERIAYRAAGVVKVRNDIVVQLHPEFSS